MEIREVRVGPKCSAVITESKDSNKIEWFGKIEKKNLRRAMHSKKSCLIVFNLDPLEAFVLFWALRKFFWRKRSGSKTFWDLLNKTNNSASGSTTVSFHF